MPNTSVTVEYSYWPGFRFCAMAVGAPKHAANATDAKNLVAACVMGFIVGLSNFFEGAGQRLGNRPLGTVTGVLPKLLGRLGRIVPGPLAAGPSDLV